jgi:phage baseplate assembly protein W
LPIVKKWSDFDLDFSAHPNTGDLSMKKDEAAIVRSIRHLLLTNYYEKPFHPEIGSNLVRQLFEPMTLQTTLNIKQSIIDAINNYEPRVQLNEINIQPRENENGYVIFLRFFIINEEVERVTQFFLERTR